MLGMPVFMMKQIMPYGEYNRWLRYLMFRKPDTNEMQMAVLSSMVAGALGTKNSSPKHFLINKTKSKNKVLPAKNVQNLFSSLATKKG